MPFFSKFKSKGATPAKTKEAVDVSNGRPLAPQKPRWQSSWNSREIVPEEVRELIHTCTAEMKTRAEALNAPFLLLPFRLDSDPSGARTFIRNFFKANAEGSPQYRGAGLRQELRLTEPIVLCSIMKWCWSRIPGGVVTWPVYEGFQLGERDSNLARNAFDTFIPIGAGSEARTSIILDFFDLIATIAAHGKNNGLGGRKLSRLAGWWAFEHSDDGKGFEGGYKSWTNAADAASHLFFAYMRSLAPDASAVTGGISKLPRSLQALLVQTEYPPETPTLMQTSTPKVVMFVDSVSPTPFALLRRAKHFEYRDQDRVLQKYSEYEDPLQALTEECKRVLYAVSSTNQSAAARSRHGKSGAKPDESWSTFSDLGFSDLTDNSGAQQKSNGVNGSPSPPSVQGLHSVPRSRNHEHGRPTTPSWADFLSSGFPEDGEAKSPPKLLFPPDKQLPPLGSRAQSSRSHLRNGDSDEGLEPGVLASVTNVDLDDTFWWVWMTSLAGEEPMERKAVFGRCALIETNIMGGRWLIMEEQLKGASPGQGEGAYIAEKKSRFSFTKRGRLGRRRSTDKKQPTPQQLAEDLARTTSATPSKSSIAPDQQAKIRAAAAALMRKEKAQDDAAERRGRIDDATSIKTNSVMTLGLQSEAGPAMQWANAFDKNNMRAQYLGDNFAGKGSSTYNLVESRTISIIGEPSNFAAAAAAPGPAGSASALAPVAEPSTVPREDKNKELPAMPRQHKTVLPETLQEVPQRTHRASEPLRLPPKAAPIVTVDPVQEQTEASTEQMPPSETAQPEVQDAIEKETGVPTTAPDSPKLGKVGRKPVPRYDNIRDHPAFRKKSEETPKPSSPTQNPAQIAAQRALESKASDSSPESLQKGQGREAQKNKKGNGFKAFFGRKKDNPNRHSFQAQPPGQNNISSLQPPSENNIGRKLSFRRKPDPAVAAATTAAAAAAAAAAPRGSRDVPVSSPISAEPQPPMPAPNGYEEPHSPEMSRVNTQNAQDAGHTFSNFDQGPMEDMPAIVPQDSMDDMHDAGEETPPAPPKYSSTGLNTRAAALLRPDVHQEAESERPSEDYATPMEAAATRHNHDAQSTASVEDPPREPPQPQESQDRWAQIRENAVRRAALANAGQSTQGRPSQGGRTQGTDDGETSGEETIESRVARIKARVAELTGNMDTASNGVAQH